MALRVHPVMAPGVRLPVNAPGLFKEENYCPLYFL
jgi:hypothetical protein